jgi:PAS domain S-box-containing protein
MLNSQSHTPQQLEVLVEISQMLSTLDLDIVLSRVVGLTTEVVGASRGTFFLFDEPTGKLTLQRFLAARNYDPETKEHVSTRVLNEGLAGWVYQHGHAEIITDTLTDPRWVTLEGETEIARSVLCVPFQVDRADGTREPPRGILTLEHPETNHFNKTDMQLVQAIANQAATAMLNAQLFDKTQSQQRELEAILNSTTEALLTIDPHGRLGQINPAAAEALRVDSQVVKGLSLEELAAHSSLIAAIQASMFQARGGGGTHSFELHDEITHRDYVTSISTLALDEGHSSGAVITLHDVTSLKDLNRLKTHMLQMASHDLKNPLGVLLGYLDMMREDIENGIVPDLTYIEGMFRSVERMDSLIQTLLSQDRIEQTNMNKYQKLDPYALLDAVMADMSDSIKAKQHQITMQVAGNLPPVSGDAVELREAMGNLLSNAIKYTTNGGEISVRMSAEDDRFFFSVMDTGLGIPADQQSAIFNKYFRAKQTGTAQIEGTGLGLSLVKEVVERHGGNVWFQSEENVGSIFGFWLPLLS